MATSAVVPVHECFSKFSTLDQAGFFQALVAAGYPDLSSSPLAGFIFQAIQQDNGVSLSVFSENVETVEKARTLFRNHAGQKGTIDNLQSFQEIALKFLTHAGARELFPTLASTLEKDADSAESVRMFMDEEAFARYDMNEDGVIDESEILAFAFVVQILCDAFTSIVGDNEGLTRELFPLALKRIGLPDVERTFQGQFFDSVFRRANSSGSGVLSFGEFVKAGVRLIYPVTHFENIKNVRGYPGWEVLTQPPSVEQVKDIAKLVSTLDTGDVVLMQGSDDVAMGRFLKFSLDTPWSHVAVVIKRSPLTGIANEKTEEILQKHEFRRRAHHFCSPGYCRCFDKSEGDFAPSRFTGLGKIGLLESTGEGIHLYDFAHRLFESGRHWESIAVARLHDAPGRDDTEKINQFLESVRGGVYTVAKNELRAAISYHKRGSPASILLPKASRETDDFCASLVQRFYYHMGWVDGSRPSNSVMPADFDISAEEDILAGTGSNGASPVTSYPVELAEGQGWIAPLELITCPDLGAKLPLKLPKKTQKA